MCDGSPPTRDGRPRPAFRYGGRPPIYGQHRVSGIQISSVDTLKLTLGVSHTPGRLPDYSTSLHIAAWPWLERKPSASPP